MFGTEDEFFPNWHNRYGPEHKSLRKIGKYLKNR